MSNSCYGNGSFAELGDIQILGIDSLKKFKLSKDNLIKSGKCGIPGFNPPLMPQIATPPITLISPIPVPQILCLLPPIPPLPRISLPSLKIPIPPLPFLPAIPIELPDLNLPKILLPKLPSLAIPAISFICPQIRIPGVVVDPFASINDAIQKANDAANQAFNALNDAIQSLCRNIDDTKARTEAPGAALETEADPGVTTIVGAKPKVQAQRDGGINASAPVRQVSSITDYADLLVNTASLDEIERALAGMNNDEESVNDELEKVKEDDFGQIKADREKLKPENLTYVEEKAFINKYKEDKIFVGVTDYQIFKKVKSQRQISPGAESHYSDFNSTRAPTKGTIDVTLFNSNIEIISPKYIEKNAIEKNANERYMSDYQVLNDEQNQEEKNRESLKLAYYLADKEIIPLELSYINKLSQLIRENFDNLTPITIFNYLKYNNIPTAKSFVGFKSLEIYNILTDLSGGKYSGTSDGVTFSTEISPISRDDFTKVLIDKGLLIGSNEILEKVYNILPNDISGLTAFELSAKMNSIYISYNGKAKEKIREDDLIYSFYINPISEITGANIVKSLVKTGTIDKSNLNVILAEQELKTLPELMEPSKLVGLLKSVNGGKALGSLRAKYIALKRGVREDDLIALERMKEERRKILELGLVDKIIAIRVEELVSKLKEYEDYLYFPINLSEVSPFLSTIFEVDDSAFSSYDGKFNSVEEIASYVKSIGDESSSNITLDNSSFSFEKLAMKVQGSLSKYGVNFDGELEQICNCLSLELKWSYRKLLVGLKGKEFKSWIELAFIILMLGLNVVEEGVVSNYTIKIEINSPTTLLGSLIDSTLNVALKVKTNDNYRIVNRDITIVKDGEIIGGNVSITRNEKLNILTLNIEAISNFNSVIDSIDKIDVNIKYNRVGMLVFEDVPSEMIKIY